MPLENRRGSYHDHRFEQRARSGRQHRDQPSVQPAEPGTRRRAAEHDELVAEQEVLGGDDGARSDESQDRCECVAKEVDHLSTLGPGVSLVQSGRARTPSAACASNFCGAQPKTLPRCVGSEVLSGRAVERVDPLYAGTQTKSSSLRLQGAVLTVRPIRGATAEWLDRSLECHGVGRMLGRSSTLANAVDPFVLPGSLVQIYVHSAGDGSRVELVGATTADAREILSMADSFLGRNGEPLATDLSGR
jgi:hypothetical protein